MKFNNEQAIYIQISEYIKEKIIRGELSSGSQAPPVREVAEKLKVNPNTVQRAYQELKKEKILYGKRGLGNFVCEDKSLIQNLKSQMSEQLIDSFVIDANNLGLEKSKTIEEIDNIWEDKNDKN